MTQLHTMDELRDLQEMDLCAKVAMTEERIHEWQYQAPWGIHKWLSDIIPRWIPVTEQEPESGELVIGYAYARKCVAVVRVSGDNVDGITHWMPLPKLPIPAEEVE